MPAVDSFIEDWESVPVGQNVSAHAPWLWVNIQGGTSGVKEAVGETEDGSTAAYFDPDFVQTGSYNELEGYLTQNESTVTGDVQMSADLKVAKVGSTFSIGQLNHIYFRVRQPSASTPGQQEYQLRMNGEDDAEVWKVLDTGETLVGTYPSSPLPDIQKNFRWAIINRSGAVHFLLWIDGVLNATTVTDSGSPQIATGLYFGLYGLVSGSLIGVGRVWIDNVSVSRVLGDWNVGGRFSVREVRGMKPDGLFDVVLGTRRPQPRGLFRVLGERHRRPRGTFQVGLGTFRVAPRGAFSVREERHATPSGIFRAIATYSRRPRGVAHVRDLYQRKPRGLFNILIQTFVRQTRGLFHLRAEYNPIARGTYSLLAGTFAHKMRGVFRVADALERYEVQLGIDAPPVPDAPAYITSPTVPFDLGPLQPGHEYWVIVQWRNQHGILSASREMVRIETDEAGFQVPLRPSTPYEIAATPGPGGTIVVMAFYDYDRDGDGDRADRWLLFFTDSTGTPDVPDQSLHSPIIVDRTGGDAPEVLEFTSAAYADAQNVRVMVMVENSETGVRSLETPFVSATASTTGPTPSIEDLAADLHLGDISTFGDN